MHESLNKHRHQSSSDDGDNDNGSRSSSTVYGPLGELIKVEKSKHLAKKKKEFIDEAKDIDEKNNKKVIRGHVAETTPNLPAQCKRANIRQDFFNDVRAYAKIELAKMRKLHCENTDNTLEHLIVVEENHDTKSWLKLMNKVNFYGSGSGSRRNYTFDIDQFKSTGKPSPHYHISALFKKPINFQKWSHYAFTPRVQKKDKIAQKKGVGMIRPSVARKNSPIKDVSILFFHQKPSFFLFFCHCRVCMYLSFPLSAL